VHEPCYAKEVTTQDCPSPKLHSHGMNPRVTLLHPQAILRAGEVGVWQITDSKSAPRTWSFDEGQTVVWMRAAPTSCRFCLWLRSPYIEMLGLLFLIP
jgi:hypothetical protein